VVSNAIYRPFPPDLSGENYIETIWGRGYVMREPHEETVDIKPAMAA